MKSRTIGAIVLSPRNLRGHYNFMLDSLSFLETSAKDGETKQDDPDDLLWEGYRSLVESDILDLLNWMALPMEQEIQAIWSGKYVNGDIFGKNNSPSRSALFATRRRKASKKAKENWTLFGANPKK